MLSLKIVMSSKDFQATCTRMLKNPFSPRLLKEDTEAGSHAQEGDLMTPSPSPRQRGRPPHGMRRLLPVVALVMVCVPGAFLPMPGTTLVEAGQSAAPSAEQPDPQRLVGRWVRPDGGYVLALGEVTKEGSVKASYFNPRPINVSRAEVRRVAGALTVLVELRDVNYPGSTYTLQYDPASDRLKGAYFQAVEKQTFVVEFVRAK
jgi:hypothetical protein